MLEKFKSNLKLIKDNLSVILIVPAILGGLWQLIELSSIETSYIRFFSVSQLVADGILILFILSTIYLSLQLILLLLYPNLLLKNLKNETEDIKKNKAPSIKTGVGLTISSLLLFSLFSLSVFLFDFDKLSFKLFFLIPMLIFTIFCLVLFLEGLTEIIKAIVYKDPQRVKKFTEFLRNDKKKFFIKRTVAIILLFLFFFILYLLYFTVNNLRNLYLIPTNLENRKNITCLVSKEYPKAKEIKIHYFNDSYFFIEILNKSGSKSIVIYKFEEMFNNNCKSLNSQK